VTTHVKEVAEQGYTILPGVIDPELVDALAADLVRLEEQLGTVPATNSF